MNKDHENQIVREALDDKEAFGKLYELFVDKIYRYVRWKVTNKEDAEDIVSQVFEKVLQSLPSFTCSPHSSLQAWTYKIAYYTLQDFYRQTNKQKIYTTSFEEDIFPSSHLSPSQNAENAAVLRQVRRYIAELKTIYREILEMKYFGELSNREISYILGINEKTVSVYSIRAIAILKVKIGANDYGKTS